MTSLAASPPAASRPIAAGTNPFSFKAVLALVVIGAALFVALLWMIGNGMADGSTNDGGGHAGGTGLNGFAAMADYLDKRGFAVRKSRSAGALDDPGVLVLTPPAGMDGKAIDKIVSARRYIGPTIVITPKWVAVPVPAQLSGARDGWVQLAGTSLPRWTGFLDDVGVELVSSTDGQDGARWSTRGLSGKLPDGRTVLVGGGGSLIPLVRAQGTKGHSDILAAFLGDGGYYPALDTMAARESVDNDDSDDALYPLVIVFEPDLLDNYGMARVENARLAEQLITASGATAGSPVIFDLTMNGLGRSANLLTLAFTPPFLAATLCLVLTAFVIGWRAFLRFGPPFAAERAIAFGKRSLVANSAGLIRRSRRFHLLGPPYAERSRERIVSALGLPQEREPARMDAAIDRMAAARAPGHPAYTALADKLRQARNSHDLMTAARELHALERMLIR